MTYVGGPKNYWNCLKKNWLKYLYKFETLAPFEVLPLRLDAAIPAPLAMLETLSKIFNGNAVKGRQRIASSRRGSTSKRTKVSNLYK